MRSSRVKVSPDSEARSHLRHSLANLRKAIGDRQATPPFLSITRETIQFNSDGDCWVDVAEFVALAEGGQPGQWEEAATLYGGPFLQGFSIRDSAAYEEWVLLHRERLHRLAQETLGRLAEEGLELGAHAREGIEQPAMRARIQKANRMRRNVNV